MKVMILKNPGRPTIWYNGKIGRIFDVVDYDKEHYKVKNKKLFIRKCNCSEYGRMKLFKKTLDFKLFGVRVLAMLSTYQYKYKALIMFSTHRYGYKRGEKREPAPDASQTNSFTENDSDFLTSPIIKEEAL